MSVMESHQNECMPRHAVYNYNHLDRQYLVHFYRRPTNTEDRMGRLEAANKSEWKNPEPEEIQGIHELYTMNGPLYPIVYHWRMPWKYGTRWVKIAQTGHFELAAVQKDIVKS